MVTKIILASILIAIIGSTAISLTAQNFLPDFLQANAGITLNEDDIAKTVLVRIGIDGDREEYVFDSFSRIGFVRGDGTQFLLESIPSKDKKPFYEMIQNSINTSRPDLINVNIDIFSGDGTLIETLNYKKCIIYSYFIHTNDSKGKFSFLDEGNSKLQIREVTKFDCTGFKITI